MFRNSFGGNIRDISVVNKEIKRGLSVALVPLTLMLFNEKSIGLGG